MSDTGTSRFSERTISILSPLVLLALWEICARTHLVDTRFFPAPSNIIKHLFDLASSGALWKHTGASLYRLAVGFVVGCIPAVV
ncbi:MAG: ABC transporter permease, partial [Tardiphaga sp.]